MLAHWSSSAGCWRNRAVTPCLSSRHYHHEFIAYCLIRFLQVNPLPDQTAQGARYRPNTGCANASFDQALSSISQFRFCAQGLHTLAQVALAYLDVSKTFCFPGITSGTVSPGPIPKYPGRAPKGGCGVSGVAVVWCRPLDVV